MQIGVLEPQRTPRSPRKEEPTRVGLPTHSTITKAFFLSVLSVCSVADTLIHVHRRSSAVPMSDRGRNERRPPMPRFVWNCSSVCLAALPAAAAGVGWGAPAPPPSPLVPRSGIVVYEFQVKTPNEPAIKLEDQIWFKGERFRIETRPVRSEE